MRNNGWEGHITVIGLRYFEIYNTHASRVYVPAVSFQFYDIKMNFVNSFFFFFLFNIPSLPPNQFEYQLCIRNITKIQLSSEIYFGTTPTSLSQFLRDSKAI